MCAHICNGAPESIPYDLDRIVGAKQIVCLYASCFPTCFTRLRCEPSISVRRTFWKRLVAVCLSIIIITHVYSHSLHLLQFKLLDSAIYFNFPNNEQFVSHQGPSLRVV